MMANVGSLKGWETRDGLGSGKKPRVPRQTKSESSDPYCKRGGNPMVTVYSGFLLTWMRNTEELGQLSCFYTSQTRYVLHAVY